MRLPRIMTTEEVSGLKSGTLLAFGQLRSAAKRNVGIARERISRQSLLVRNKIGSSLVSTGLKIGSIEKGEASAEGNSTSD